MATYDRSTHIKNMIKWLRGNHCPTWVSGVLLVEAIDGTKHEVENHLTVRIVHARSWGQAGALVISSEHGLHLSS